ncbi:unnamed protein product [Arctogadus glacialis]
MLSSSPAWDTTPVFPLFLSSTPHYARAQRGNFARHNLSPLRSRAGNGAWPAAFYLLQRFFIRADSR